MSPETNPESFPPAWSLSPDTNLLRRKAGRLLIGGTPFRFLRLSASGASMADAWFCGRPVGDDSSAQGLARRLVDAGMAHPVIPIDPDPQVLDSLTAVIPVKNDVVGLRRTLSALGSLPAIIVDDGSQPPLRLQDLRLQGETSANVRLVRHPQSLGPGPARNRGLELVKTRHVAFVDAGVSISQHGLSRLCTHFEDVATVAVAPRVGSAVDVPEDVGSATPVGLANYEAGHSPLDLGSLPGWVRPGSRISYVPTACLVADVPALRSLPDSCTFDEDMRYGEDVDLEWRLCQVGSIRYEPTVAAAHPPRCSVTSFVKQRIGYGSSAAPLARRHGNQVSPIRTSRWSFVITGLLLFARPGLAALAMIYTSATLSKKLQDAMSDHLVEAVRFNAIGHGWAIRSVGETCIRAWWPLTVGLLFVHRVRMAALRAILVGVASKLYAARSERSPKVRLVQVAYGHLDDVSYGYGVWKGMLSERSLKAVVPDLT